MDLDFVISIYAKLLQNPGSAFIPSDGKNLYILANDRVYDFTGPDFNAMTSDEINQFVQENFRPQ